MEAEKEEIHELNGNVYRLRNPGEILFPERMPREFVEKCKQRGSLVWNALYQQRPTAKGGGLLSLNGLVNIRYSLPCNGVPSMETPHRKQKRSTTSQYSSTGAWY